MCQPSRRDRRPDFMVRGITRPSHRFHDCHPPHTTLRPLRTIPIRTPALPATQRTLTAAITPLPTATHTKIDPHYPTVLFSCAEILHNRFARDFGARWMEPYQAQTLHRPPSASTDSAAGSRNHGASTAPPSHPAEMASRPRGKRGRLRGAELPHLGYATQGAALITNDLGWKRYN